MHVSIACILLHSHPWKERWYLTCYTKIDNFFSWKYQCFVTRVNSPTVRMASTQSYIPARTNLMLSKPLSAVWCWMFLYTSRCTRFMPTGQQPVQLICGKVRPCNMESRKQMHQVRYAHNASHTTERSRKHLNIPVAIIPWSMHICMQREASQRPRGNGLLVFAHWHETDVTSASQQSLTMVLYCRIYF